MTRNMTRKPDCGMQWQNYLPLFLFSNNSINALGFQVINNLLGTFHSDGVSPHQNTLPCFFSYDAVHYQSFLFLVFHGGRFGNGTKISIYCQAVSVIA